MVRDAPFPYDYVASASIVVESIEVQSSTGGWTTVYTGPTEVDLVPLTGGNSLPLVQADLEPGTYDNVRVIVDAGQVMLTPEAFADGGDPVYSTANGRLKFPSASQSGLKVKIEGSITVVTQLSSDLVLDFDLSKNFVFNGPVTHPPGVKRVIFTPVVRATNESVAGSIQVSVSSDSLTPGDTSDDVVLAGATVEAYHDGDLDLVPPGTPAATAGTDLSGVAVLSGLAPGTYDLQVLATGHEPGRIDDVVVVVANLTPAGVTLVATGELSGTVMSDAATVGDPTDDTSLADVTVTATESGTANVVGTTTTDASGGFQIPGLSAGTYDLTFSKPGFDDASLSSLSPTLGGTGLLVVMHALTQDLQVTVTQALVPVDGAAVRVLSTFGDVVANGATDATGVATFTALPSGSYTVTVSFVDAAMTNQADQQPIEIVGTAAPTMATATFAFP